MAIKYLKKAIKTPSSDDQKTRDTAVQEILNDYRKKKRRSYQRYFKKSLISMKAMLLFLKKK